MIYSADPGAAETCAKGDQMDWETEFSTIAGEIATSTATRISGATFQSVDDAADQDVRQRVGH